MLDVTTILTWNQFVSHLWLQWTIIFLAAHVIQIWPLHVISQMSQIHHYSYNIYNEIWQNYEVNLANWAIFVKQILAKFMKWILGKLWNRPGKINETNLGKLGNKPGIINETNLAKFGNRPGKINETNLANFWNSPGKTYETNLANLWNSCGKIYETDLAKLMKQTWQIYETDLAKFMKQTWQN